MSIESIFIVLLYSAKPYIWLFLILALIPLLSYFMRLSTPLFNHFQTIIVSAAVGILVGLSAPYMTMSKLAYVSTFADWGALIGIMVVAAVYCWFTLTLLFKTKC